ncbi:L,D-transpeptidase family protein [Levilactobacillus namurensis]|uniref:L,D-transpeptidase family protein n=1 Tax=Levilactobacillus namurensis TaxID=380393 RepID=UPI002232ACE3|nr:L,D-transpeptidase family protein [Levilactobacillus namurensis]MCW3778983.1 L,D-transpeptidase/peptidoglycan binding protein [Levilactobacillus namurensis]MDT7017900.1 L,D-transpeptidase family protein [Levilactobacillus namurensis]WNN65099.1 L,D-transpeptidase family protein [Levilactobacillus namurensis]
MQKRKALVIGVVTACVAVGALYVSQAMHYSRAKVFFNDTQIAGVNVGGNTAQEAATKLKSAMHQLTLKDGKQTVSTFKPQEANLKITSVTALQQLINQQNAWSWPAHLTSATADTLKLDTSSKNQKSVQQLATQITTKANRTRTAPTDATFTYQDGQYRATKEKTGNQLDATKVAASITRALDKGQSTVNVAGDYVQPQVTVKSTAFKTALAKAQQITKQKYVYKLGKHTLTIPAETLASWITLKDGQVATNQSKVKSYLTKLSHQYGTVYKTRSFKSTKRDTVKVPAGLYGWSINVKSEAPKLDQLVAKGQGMTRTPVIQGSGYHKDGTDIGNSYVEVDKTNQHMWVYKNGKLVVSTDVVTGLPTTAHHTPSGVWVIWSKQRNTTLRGKNDNGSSYASKVKYWMPVDDTGVGIHDSPWQPQYGGTWYVKHGSHGCVNTPPSKIASVYANVKVGTPVLVF